MNIEVLNIVMVFIGGVIGTLASSGVILHLLKRNDKVMDLVEHNNRQAEGLTLVSKALITIVDKLHDQKILNGEGERIKEELHTYLFNSTKSGFYMKEDEK